MFSIAPERELLMRVIENIVCESVKNGSVLNARNRAEQLSRIYPSSGLTAGQIEDALVLKAAADQAALE
jgi:hypothetical protein